LPPAWPLRIRCSPRARKKVRSRLRPVPAFTVATQASTSIRGISLDGAEIELEKAAIKELGNAMTGPVMLSGHPDYDGARKIWNGMHDKRPALSARTKPAACRSGRWS
jgi:hypothetical protein